MNETFIGYINYGCPRAEKRSIWTEGAADGTALAAEKTEIEIPEGWDTYTNVYGQMVVTTPEGQPYLPSEILHGDDTPYFICPGHRVKLNYHKLGRVSV